MAKKILKNTTRFLQGGSTLEMPMKAAMMGGAAGSVMGKALEKFKKLPVAKKATIFDNLRKRKQSKIFTKNYKGTGY